ncbi:hypothetical protein AB0D66_18235 [Streptomyces sp. NPDC048270]|uniref:hypothetical protein n=1 Tax=Streptomyces sp. NPDC048270 TaxID=3154615 RepID=UPI00340ECE50
MAADRTDDRTTPTRTSPRRTGVLLGFAPWIIFDVIASPSTWKLAAFTALIASLVLNAPDLRRGSVKVLEITGMVFFAVISILALVLDRGDLLWLETYAQTLASGVIAAVALGSLAFTPFTEQYARESVPSQYWGTALFRRTNRVLTAVWGVVFLLIAVAGLIAVESGHHGDWFNWVIPVVLLVAAVRITAWYPDHVRSTARQT